MIHFWFCHSLLNLKQGNYEQQQDYQDDNIWESLVVIRFEVGMKILEFLNEFIGLLVDGIVGVKFIQFISEFLQFLNISLFDIFCNLFHLFDLRSHMGYKLSMSFFDQLNKFYLFFKFPLCFSSLLVHFVNFFNFFGYLSLHPVNFDFSVLNFQPQFSQLFLQCVLIGDKGFNLINNVAFLGGDSFNLVGKCLKAFLPFLQLFPHRLNHFASSVAMPRYFPLLGNPLKLRSQVKFLGLSGLSAIKKSVADVMKFIKIVNKGYFLSHLITIQSGGVDLIEEKIGSSVGFFQLMQMFLQFLVNSHLAFLHLPLKNALLVCQHSHFLCAFLLFLKGQLGVAQFVLQSVDLGLQLDLFGLQFDYLLVFLGEGSLYFPFLHIQVENFCLGVVLFLSLGLYLLLQFLE